MSRMFKCPVCGKFVKDVIALMNEYGEIIIITGKCKTHGKVDVSNSDWCYEDFFPEREEVE